MGEPYGIEALALDVAEAIARYPNERERIEAVKPSLARWMERQQGLLRDHRLYVYPFVPFVRLREHPEIRPTVRRFAPVHLNLLNAGRPWPLAQVLQKLLQILARPLSNDLDRLPVVEVAHVPCQPQKPRPRVYELPEVHALNPPANDSPKRRARLVIAFSLTFRPVFLAPHRSTSRSASSTTSFGTSSRSTGCPIPSSSTHCTFSPRTFLSSAIAASTRSRSMPSAFSGSR